MKRIIGQYNTGDYKLDCLFDNHGLRIFNTNKIEYDDVYRIDRINCKNGYFNFYSNNNQIQVYTDAGHIEIVNETVIYPDLLIQYCKGEKYTEKKKITRIVFVGGYVNKIFPYDKEKTAPINVEFKINNLNASATFVVLYKKYYNLFNLCSEESTSRLEIKVEIDEDELKSIVDSICNFIGILCNCKNVEFDNIEIYSSNNQSEYIINDFAYANLCFDKYYREQPNCVNIRRLTLKQLSNLLCLTFNYKSKKNLNFGFLQKHNKSYSIKRVCDIVNGIESLLNIIDNFDNKAYENLYLNICKEIDKSEFDNKEKDDLKEGAQYIKNPLKKRIINKYKEIQLNLNEFFKNTGYGVDDYEESIRKVVKFRNFHTHKFSGEVNEEIIKNARFLYSILYYLIFLYIGCENTEIINIMYNCITEC